MSRDASVTAGQETGHLNIGAIVFPGMDQMDFTGPFEVLSRLPNSSFHVIGKDRKTVLDAKGLVLTPEKTFATSPKLDVLLVPGGAGQMALMEDEETLAFLREQSASAKITFSTCTGALTCGAAGLLKGVRATTHWASFHLLEHFGAIPVNHRVVVDGRFVSAAGVSSGIDGALRVAAMLRGDRAAEEIQLYMQYAPEPPFTSGSPETASREVLEAVSEAARDTAVKRLEILKRIASRLAV